MVRFFKDTKALSPVIASIILIAVVVAVSVAATMWMGSLSLDFMEVEDLRITDHSWASDTSYVDLTIKNLGTSPVSLSTVKVNGVTASEVSFVSGAAKLDAGETATVRVTQSFTASTKYEFAVVTASALESAYIAVASSSGTSEIWYNPSWSKRKAVTIDNSLNPDDLTCYQVQVNVDYDSDMLADFSDLRFTSSDKLTLIPYWIDSVVPSVSAVVWVKVPSVPASSTETTYMYYGNPSATSESSPDNTFDLFVDFTVDGVITHGGTSQDVDSSQWEIINDYTLRMWGNNWKATMKTLNVVGDGSQAICFDFKSAGTQGEICGVGLDTDASLTDNRFYQIYGTQSWGNRNHFGYTGGGDWQSYSLILNDFSGTFNRLIFSNDDDSAPATNIYYKNVRVSQYTSQAPTVDAGTEETL